MFDSIPEILHIIEPIIKSPPNPEDLIIQLFPNYVLLKITVDLNDIRKVLTFRFDEIELHIEEVLDEG